MTYELRIERHFDASPEAVFDAFADRTAQGVLHGTSAYHYALQTIGQPASTPIYFTVDYDALQGHVIGGISQRTGPAEARGFMRAVHGCRTLGFSLYDFAGTSTAAWRTLIAPAAPDDSASCS